MLGDYFPSIAIKCRRQQIRSSFLFVIHIRSSAHSWHAYMAQGPWASCDAIKTLLAQYSDYCNQFTGRDLHRPTKRMQVIQRNNFGRRQTDRGGIYWRKLGTVCMFLCCVEVRWGLFGANLNGFYRGKPQAVCKFLKKISFALRSVEVGLGEPKRCLLKEALSRLHGSMPLRFDPTLAFIILKGLSQGGPQRSMT